MDTPADNATAKRNLEAAASYFDDHRTDPFPTIRDIDKMTLTQVQALRAYNNVFGACVGALREEGVSLGTNVGEVMNAFGMVGEKGRQEAHDFACYCNSGETILGSHAASKLRQIAATRIPADTACY